MLYLQLKCCICNYNTIFIITIIGAVRVSYEASSVELSDDQTLAATPNEDFNPDTQSVVLADGEASTVIPVPIIDVSNLSVS